MWKYWANAILGLWIILVPYLGFELGAKDVLLVVSGIVIAALAFWSVSEAKNTRDLM